MKRQNNLVSVQVSDYITDINEGSILPSQFTNTVSGILGVVRFLDHEISFSNDCRTGCVFTDITHRYGLVYTPPIQIVSIPLRPQMVNVISLTFRFMIFLTHVKQIISVFPQ